MGATNIPLTSSQARAVAKASRKWLTFPGDVRIKVIEAYCETCGGTWAEAQEVDCLDDEGHAYTGAALIPLDDAAAVRAVREAAVSWPGRFEIDVLEIYCSDCRRPYQAVASRPCEAAVSNEHLRGGPIGTRAPRKHDHDCDAVGCPGPGNSRPVAGVPLARLEEDDTRPVAVIAS